MKRSRTVTALAGIGALAVVLLCAGFWREIYYLIRPEARLWGGWELIDSSNPLLAQNLKHTIDISKDGKLSVRSGGEFLARSRFYGRFSLDYTIEDEQTLSLSGSGLRFIQKFRFEGNDILLIENPGFFDRYRRLPSGD